MIAIVMRKGTDAAGHLQAGLWSPQSFYLTDDGHGATNFEPDLESRTTDVTLVWLIRKSSYASSGIAEPKWDRDDLVHRIAVLLHEQRGIEILKSCRCFVRHVEHADVWCSAARRLTLMSRTIILDFGWNVTHLSSSSRCHQKCQHPVSLYCCTRLGEELPTLPMCQTSAPSLPCPEPCWVHIMKCGMWRAPGQSASPVDFAAWLEAEDDAYGLL